VPAPSQSRTFAQRHPLPVRRHVTSRMALRSGEWRALVSSRFLREDLIAAVSVACIALPLSLGVALASGAPPIAGMVSAIVAGLLGSLVGGTPLAVSGPSMTMAVIAATVIEQHGPAGLELVVVMAGALLLVCGLFRLGRFFRFMPAPVVAGVTAGIGAIIFVGQLPRALGLPPPAQAHIFDAVTHLGRELADADAIAVLIAVLATATTLWLPRLAPRLPGAFLAVVIPAIICWLFTLDVDAVGPLPRRLPALMLPGLPAASALGSLVGASLTVFALVSLETLFTSAAVDKMTHGTRHDPDRELVGQGLANAGSALLGGLPASAVMARSAVNVQAGAKTRRASFFHAAMLLAMVAFFGPLIARIPLAALAGVLLAVSLRMMDVRYFRHLVRTAPSDAWVLGLTFVAIVLGDIIAGVQVGVFAAFVVAAVRMGRMRADLVLDRGGAEPSRLRLSGPLTFLSTSALDPVRSALECDPAPRELLIDLGGVTVFDVSGAEMLGELVSQLEARSARVALVGVGRDAEVSLRGADAGGDLIGHLAR